MTEHQQIIDALALNDEDESPIVASKEVVGEVSADRRQVWSSRLATEHADTLLPTDALVLENRVRQKKQLSFLFIFPHERRATMAKSSKKQAAPKGAPKAEAPKTEEVKKGGGMLFPAGM